MENNNNEVLIKLNMLVTKIDELEKQIALLKTVNSAINSRIDRETSVINSRIDKEYRRHYFNN